ncbi:MAG TPA: YciI family protein [Candidatus Cloacimonadota bacterium]|nr:YciI family protein [Candidatus Cloacimonadota bacterium]
MDDHMITNPNYNADLAEKTGADEYGMKRYILVILKSGDNQSQDKTFQNQCFKGHMDNIQKLEEEGKLIVAGPMHKNPNKYRGIFIFNTESVSEAEKLTQNDPAIKADFLRADYYEWYGSAALPLYLEYAKQIWKVNP